MNKIPTTCVYCGCGCGLYLHEEDGQVVGASPSPLHPMSKGRLCIKGWLIGEFVGHPDRLKFPLIREGDRFIRASWDKALDLVATMFKELSDSYGPDCLGVLSSAKGSNEENYLLMKLARAALKTNNIDHAARLCHAPTVAGLSFAFGSGAMTNSINSLAKSNVILIVGSNTTEQHPLIGSYIMEAKASGAKIIVVDPRRTPLAAQADIHLSPKLGTDIAWINAFLNVIVQEGLLDQEFINARTEGFESVRQLVADYTPEIAEKISGIPAEDIKKAAIVYGSADRASIVYAMGITQHIVGTDNVQALANLVLATGNIGREGTGLCPLRGHQNVQGACDMGALPNVFTGYQYVADKANREKFENAWGTTLPETPGLTALEMMNAALEGKLKGLLIVGVNPVMSFPDISKIKKALEALDFLVVSDIFPTETTEYSDVILPAASFAEKDGTFTSTERRVQRIRRVVDPPGEAKAEWQWIGDLQSRMGVPANYSSAAEIMEEIAAITPIYGGISFDRLGIEGLQWPCPSKDHPGTKNMHSEKFPIGRARFRPVQHLPPSETPDEEYPLLLTTGRSLYHFHTGTMTRRTSLLEREVPAPFVQINPDDAGKKGIRNSQMVVVETRRGSIKLGAQVTSDVPLGHIFVPFHFSEAPANELTIQSLDPKSKIPELKVSAARIRRSEN
jgi:formate dehydrogenase alpha subunit